MKKTKDFGKYADIGIRQMYMKGGPFMDIAAISANLGKMKSAQAVSLRVAKISMDAVKQQSADMAKMLQNSVQPHLGGKIDMKL